MPWLRSSRTLCCAKRCGFVAGRHSTSCTSRRRCAIRRTSISSVLRTARSVQSSTGCVPFWSRGWGGRSSSRAASRRNSASESEAEDGGAPIRLKTEINTREVEAFDVPMALPL